MCDIWWTTVYMLICPRASIQLSTTGLQLRRNMIDRKWFINELHIKYLTLLTTHSSWYSIKWITWLSLLRPGSNGLNYCPKPSYWNIIKPLSFGWLGKNFECLTFISACWCLMGCWWRIPPSCSVNQSVIASVQPSLLLLKISSSVVVYNDLITVLQCEDWTESGDRILLHIRIPTLTLVSVLGCSLKYLGSSDDDGLVHGWQHRYIIIVY